MICLLFIVVSYRKQNMRMVCIFLGLPLILVPVTGEDLQKLDLSESK